MIKQLEDAFKEAAQLSEDEQMLIAECIRQIISSEKRWQELFNDPRSEHVLDKMVAEALAEDEAGQVSDW